MLDEIVLDLIIAIYAIAVGILFCFVCFKQKRIDPWIAPALLYGIASLIFYFRIVDEIYRIIAASLFIIVSFIFIIITFNEYYHLILQKRSLVPLALAMAFDAIFFLRIVMIILIAITAAMLFHIYLLKRTPTRMFMFLTLVTVLISLVTGNLDEFGIYGAWELSYAVTFVTISFFFATGLSSFLELRLVASETKSREAYNRAEFFKDLFLHDMSNILQGIMSAKDLLNLRKKTDSNFDEIPPLIEAQILRAAKLISDIRKLSDAEEIKIALAPSDLSAALTKAISFVKQTYNQKNLQIQVVYPDKPRFVIANPLLSDLLENILLNAVKHNKSPVIEIEIKISEEQIEKQRWIKLQFLDNGVGIPDTLKKVLFERNWDPFGLQGMRLGLSIVKTIINSYAARIWIEDRVPGDSSKGSNFILILREVS
jgi:signal transduction histidine kinase